ncbi:aspartyl-phosphate phosphatase Spo0E family protein [Paenibacillus sp. YIM B09110]|uniref:aspartyl-phosphate phosphatase Spo0E family protein n=1 Tax=Paenibacillus sp. YIM B09110 TaxID=3126102 RepID=UPI003FA6BB88
MHNCVCQQQIEALRTEMVRVFGVSNSFSDRVVIQISQELDKKLMEYTNCSSRIQKTDNRDTLCY